VKSQETEENPGLIKGSDQIKDRKAVDSQVAVGNEVFTPTVLVLWYTCDNRRHLNSPTSIH
jgi:hypothetical protein